jgi:hypothetical protein
MTCRILAPMGRRFRLSPTSAAGSRQATFNSPSSFAPPPRPSFSRSENRWIQVPLTRQGFAPILSCVDVRWGQQGGCGFAKGEAAIRSGFRSLLWCRCGGAGGGFFTEVVFSPIGG